MALLESALQPRVRASVETGNQCGEDDGKRAGARWRCRGGHPPPTVDGRGRCRGRTAAAPAGGWLGSSCRDLPRALGRGRLRDQLNVCSISSISSISSSGGAGTGASASAAAESGREHQQQRRWRRSGVGGAAAASAADPMEQTQGQARIGGLAAVDPHACPPLRCQRATQTHQHALDHPSTPEGPVLHTSAGHPALHCTQCCTHPNHRCHHPPQHPPSPDPHPAQRQPAAICSRPLGPASSGMQLTPHCRPAAACSRPLRPASSVPHRGCSTWLAGPHRNHHPQPSAHNPGQPWCRRHRRRWRCCCRCPR